MRQQWHEVPVEVIPENSLDLYKNCIKKGKKPWICTLMATNCQILN